MKKALSLILALVLCLSLCACGGRNTTSSENEASSTLPKCAHVYSNGYCTNCKEMDPSCRELTVENYEDYLNITPLIAKEDGSTNTNWSGTIYSPYFHLTVTSTSSRIMFYDVEIEMEFTVKLMERYFGYKECTVTAKIPVALFGDGQAKVELENQYAVVLSSSYISEYKIVSIKGCVSVQ